MGEYYLPTERTVRPVDPYAHIPNGSAIRIDSPFKHEAIFWRTVDGRAAGYHNDPHFGVCYQLLDEITEGRSFQVFMPLLWDGHDAEIQQRCEAVRGTNFNLLNWNCQSFVHYAYFGVPHSESVRKGVLWTTLLGGAAAIWFGSDN